jgi:methylase of polypeptide subunit release factors
MALDLGTGFGFQALLAARHAHRVVGTDINPRALNFAALNARLNGLSNIELRLGGLYEPVADARFDLIVANPPFVISPQAQYEYRDGGLPGDALSEQVIRGAPKLLSEGGYCTVLFNWHHPTQESWADRPTVWVGSSGCDAWIICTEMTDPIGYTATWLATEKGPDATRYERLFDEWLAYYERLGIRFISSGIMVLRRRAAPANWIRAEAAPPGEAPGSCSEQIQRIFAAEDLLQSLGEERNLLDQALLLTPGHRLEHDLQTEGGRWVVKAARLRQTQGLPFVGNVDQMVSRLLAGCDGRRTLRQLATDLAAALSVNFEQVAPSCLAVMRTLLKAGFLTAPGKLPDRT